MLISFSFSFYITLRLLFAGLGNIMSVHSYRANVRRGNKFSSESDWTALKSSVHEEGWNELSDTVTRDGLCSRHLSRSYSCGVRKRCTAVVKKKSDECTCHRDFGACQDFDFFNK